MEITASQKSPIGFFNPKASDSHWEVQCWVELGDSYRQTDGWTNGGMDGHGIGSNLSKSDQTCVNWIKPNLSKLDQTCPNWIKLVQIGSNLSKLDQTCPNWIKLVQIGLVMSKLDQTCWIWIKFVQIGLDMSKLDHTCPNWIKPVQIGSNFCCALRCIAVWNNGHICAALETEMFFQSC